MGSTSSTLATAILDKLAGSVQFAFLHNERSAAEGELSSDFDLITSYWSARDTVRAVAESLKKLDILPVTANEYDSGSVAIWFATPSGCDGVQLDLTFSHVPRNQFGLDYSGWMESAKIGGRWNTVRSQDEDLYRSRKRAYKHDGWRPSKSLGRTTCEGVRIFRRVMEPSGFWAHVAGASNSCDVRSVTERFGRFLPVARDAPYRTGVTNRLTQLPHLRGTLLRPALLTTYSTSSPGDGPEIVVDGRNGNPETWSEEIRREMFRRLCLRYRL